jgi:hypothetical protein
MEQDEYVGQSTASAVLSTIDEIRGIFAGHFESGWFLTVLERLSFNTVYLNDIRHLVEMRSLYPSDTYRIRTGVIALQEFIGFSRRYLLPVLRDQLGISGFTRQQLGDRDPTTRVVKELFASAFPHNIERLSELTDRLSLLLHTLTHEETLSRGEIEILEALPLLDPRFPA